MCKVIIDREIYMVWEKAVIIDIVCLIYITQCP